MESPQQQHTVAMIGGGLVGTLQAIFLANHGETESWISSALVSYK